MKINKNIVLLLLCTLLCAPQCLSGRGEAPDTFLLNELCSSVYAGRRIGTEGNRLVEQLLAERLKINLLTPLTGYSDFLLPFEQSIAVIGETKLTATMADGSREELIYGKDYMFVGTASTIDGTFPVSLQPEKADAAAVLFVDTETVQEMPADGDFATMVNPGDTLRFNSLGIVETGFTASQGATLPRIYMIRSVYERISEAVSLDILYDFAKTTINAHNVAGVLPGKDRTRAVVLSAHLDGAGDQAGNRLPCAMDNASGVAVVDLVLSQMAGTEPPYDVVFAFTNAEEAGLTGAYDLSKRIVSQYEALYNINVDCVGIEALPFPIQSPDERSAPLYTKMETYLSRNGFISTPEVYGGGDHVAFERVGIPSVVLGTPNVDMIHIADDIPAHIDPDVIRRVAEMIVDFIAENPDMHTVLAENRDTETVMEDTPQLKYNEAVVLDDTLYLGSRRWMTYAEALQYYPTLPLPQTYKQCPIEACQVVLSSFLFDIAPGQIITLPDSRENILEIAAYYSDGVTGYSLKFIAGDVRDGYARQRIGEEGFLLKTYEDDGEVVHGIGFQKNNASLYLFDGDATDQLFEIETGLSIHSLLYGTSKATEENASTLLSDPELTELFDALVNFIQP